MTIELTLQIFFTFKRRKSLYFWSLLICTWGIAGHVLGLILKLFNEGNWIISSIVGCAVSVMIASTYLRQIFKIGWVSNVTGFSIVLYSRLNLVVRNRKILRAVLCMICIDAVLFHTPIIIFDFGISSPHPNVWYWPMIVMEKIQVVGFSIQESIISMLYIYHASKFLKDVYTRQTHRVMQLLIFAQLMAILFDISLITVDCNNMFTLKVIIHPFAYAIKLKMEFVVLNQLLALIKHGFAPGEFPAPDEESPDISGPTTVRSGTHVHLSHMEKSMNAEENEDPSKAAAGGRPAPETNGQDVIVRDMQNRIPEVLVEQVDPDIISPTVAVPPSLGRMERRPVSRGSHEDPQLPPRSFSDPMPLSLSQQEHVEMERRYLGRFGMELQR
jgi:hypothetical protein